MKRGRRSELCTAKERTVCWESILNEHASNSGPSKYTRELAAELDEADMAEGENDSKRECKKAARESVNPTVVDGIIVRVLLLRFGGRMRSFHDVCLLECWTRCNAKVSRQRPTESSWAGEREPWKRVK